MSTRWSRRGNLSISQHATITKVRLNFPVIDLVNDDLKDTLLEKAER